MVCIYCGSKTKVINSRSQKKLNQTWRRRECLNCRAVVTSVEGVNLPTSVLFIRNQGVSEPFQRDILFISVYESLLHRNDAVVAATALTSTVLSKLMDQIEQAGLQRQNVIQTTTEVLKRFDKAAAVHYQAYYPV
jgi:transcriptional regulator NrdR family protein